jgi:hypothetical protein
MFFGRLKSSRHGNMRSTGISSWNRRLNSRIVVIIVIVIVAVIVVVVVDVVFVEGTAGEAEGIVTLTVIGVVVVE